MPNESQPTAHLNLPRDGSLGSWWDISSFFGLGSVDGSKSNLANGIASSAIGSGGGIGGGIVAEEPPAATATATATATVRATILAKGLSEAMRTKAARRQVRIYRHMSDPERRKEIQAALDAMYAAIERLTSQLEPVALEAAVVAALRSSGAIGARRYGAGQSLTVRMARGWCDADVVTAGADGLCHHLTFDGIGEPPVTLMLHPWNNAPRELPHAVFEAMRASWVRFLAQHSSIIDALTGKQLDALQQ